MSSLVLFDLNDKKPHPLIRILTPQGIVEVRCTGERTVMTMHQGDGIDALVSTIHQTTNLTWEGYKKQDGL